MRGAKVYVDDGSGSQRRLVEAKVVFHPGAPRPDVGVPVPDLMIVELKVCVCGGG